MDGQGVVCMPKYRYMTVYSPVVLDSTDASLVEENVGIV